MDFDKYPLLTGQLPPEISTRLVDHLTDPSQFWPSYPIPTVAVNDSAFNPIRMWRGPTWANVNYLLIEELLRSGYEDVARKLRRSTLKMMCGCDDICEYYHPETGEKSPEAASMFG